MIPSATAQCGVDTPSSVFSYQGDGDMLAGGSHPVTGEPVPLYRGGQMYDAGNRLTEVLDAPEPQISGVGDPSQTGVGCADLNGDGKVNSVEVQSIFAAFKNGMKIGKPGYNYLMDLFQTGTISSSDSTREQSWFSSIPGGVCQASRDVYTYDGNGTLLKRQHLVNGASTWQEQSSTIYIGGVYELHQDGSTTKYYAAMGQTIAVRQTPAGGGQGTLLYALHDHLGSTVAMLDGSGNVVGTASYWPYGAIRNATGLLAVVPPATVPSATDRLYTGQRMQSGDGALGLYNYNARFYSTTLGAFVSADPTNGSGLNRFRYADDNPVRYIDPSGLCFTFSWGSDTDQSVTFSCNNDSDLTNWIKCALSCDNWMGDIARYGLGKSEFWGNFDKHFEADKLHGGEYVLVGQALETIVRYAHADTFDSISAAGFEDLSSHIPMIPGRGPYFRASLHDLIFGSNWVRDQLRDPDLEGAVDWWDYYGRFLTIAGASGANASHLDEVLRDRTLSYALTLDALVGPGAVTSREWSPFQWEAIGGHVPGVQVPEERVRCVDDPDCLDHLIQIGLGGRPGGEPE